MIKLLVSTSKTQGDRSDDFCFVPDGEIVYSGFECSTQEVRDRCGCGRSMVGTNCLKATTTMTPVLFDMSEKEFADLILSTWSRAGFVKLPLTHPLYKEREEAANVARDLILSALPFDVGKVVERRNLVLRER